MDKRQHDRITLKEIGWHAELLDQVGGNKLGEVVNLSPSGLILITANPVEIENLYQVECVASGPDGQSGRFTAGVIVLWRTDASQRDTYWAGMQIIDIDAASQARLLEVSSAMAANS